MIIVPCCFLETVFYTNSIVFNNEHPDPRRDNIVAVHRLPRTVHPPAGFSQVQMGAALQPVEVMKRRGAQVTLSRQGTLTEIQVTTN